MPQHHNTLSVLFYNFKRYLLFRTQINSPSSLRDRLLVVAHFSSGIVERAKRERAWKSPHARKAIRGGKRGKIFSLFSLSRRVSSFLAWGDFHARSRFARSTIPEEKWGTTRSLSKGWVKFLVRGKYYQVKKSSLKNSMRRFLHKVCNQTAFSCFYC